MQRVSAQSTSSRSNLRARPQMTSVLKPKCDATESIGRDEEEAGASKIRHLSLTSFANEPYVISLSFKVSLIQQCKA